MSRAFVPVSFLLFGPLAMSAAAQSIMPFLPEDTIMALSTPDLAASMGDFSASPLAKMWREKEVQDFVQDARELVVRKIDEALAQAKEMHAAGQLPVDPGVAADLRLQGMTFAVTKLGIEAGDFGPVPEVGLILQLDFGPSAQQWFQLLQVGLGMLEQQEDVECERAKLGDDDFICLSPKSGPPGMAMGINVAMTGNSLIIGTLREQVQQVVERMKRGEQALGAADSYKATFAQLHPAGAEMQMFLRTDPLLDFAIEAIGVASSMNRRLAMIDKEGVARAIAALGLRSMRSFATTSRYEEGKAISERYIASPAPERKGLFGGSNKNVDLGFLRWVPKDAVTFEAWSIEPVAVYDALVATVNAYDPKIGEMLMGHLAHIEQAEDCKLRDDLVASIGDTMISWRMPLASFASPPESAWLIKINDEAKIVKSLKSIANISDGKLELDEAEKRGVKTYQFRINMDPMRGMGGMNPFEILNPSFAFKNGYMVIGFSPSDIRQVFKRMDRTDDDPKTDIRGNKEFAAYAGSLPKEMQYVAFTDWKANFESFYQIVGSLLAFVPPNDDIPLDMAMLPDASTLTKHLFGAFAYEVSDANGRRMTSVSPFGPEVDIALMALVAGGVSAFLGMRARF